MFVTSSMLLRCLDLYFLQSMTWLNIIWRGTLGLIFAGFDRVPLCALRILAHHVALLVFLLVDAVYCWICWFCKFYLSVYCVIANFQLVASWFFGCDCSILNLNHLLIVAYVVLMCDFKSLFFVPIVFLVMNIALMALMMFATFVSSDGFIWKQVFGSACVSYLRVYGTIQIYF